MVKTIEGVPEGWELVRVGIPKYSEHFIDYEGYIRRCHASPSLHNSTRHPIVRERLFYYIAKKDLSFMDESTHIKGWCYFPSPESQAYFDVMKNHYEKMILETEDHSGRTIASPNHDLGYTKSYLSGWMKATGYYDFDAFSVWMSGQTVGVNDNGETVYYYHDVFRYICKGGVLAEVED